MPHISAGARLPDALFFDVLVQPRGASIWTALGGARDCGGGVQVAWTSGAGLVAKRCWIGQVLIYGILDVISKAVFGLILMSGASTGYEAI